jgi:RHS repeat-associated protein
VVGEAPAGAATPTTYAYGPAGVAAQRGATSLYPMTDSLGSVRGLADATGALSGRRATDAFGATRGLVGAASGIGYAGEFTGAEDGKVWLRARSYDPKTGRFDQRDTFEGFAERGASLNRYSYAEGNPSP